jgi:ubiquitin C-terminal hydrolase
MISYNAEVTPRAFGLVNTGVICYLNSFLQTLVSCTAFVETVLSNKEYLSKTRTGAAVYRFVEAAHATGTPPISADVSRALISDLKERRPNFRFGQGQESASETFTFIIDMMEPPRSADQSVSVPSEVTNLFKNRFRCELHCRRCKSIVSTTTEYAINFNLFHIDAAPPRTPSEFSSAIRTHSSITEDYYCEKCTCDCGGAYIEYRNGKSHTRKCEQCGELQQKSTAVRVYKLTLIPEIIFCMFNAYGAKISRYFPEEFEIPSVKGGSMIYKLVGQVEHSGSLGGGHYWARCLRQGGVFALNDTGISPSKFENTPYTYIVAYNYAGSTS